MHQTFAFLYQFADTFAFLVLAALGLAVIFGMMGIINLAHGEFIMLGAYATIFGRHIGAPLPLAILLGGFAVGAFGVFVDRVMIRRFYHRPLDSVVATWGLSILLSQGVLILFGPSIQGDTTPLGSVAISGATYSVYHLLLGGIGVLLLLLVYALFRWTEFGLHARATMQNADVARSLGVNVERVYMVTFGLGAALAGLAGGLYEPVMTTVPTLGETFVGPAFITVVVGGANAILGTLLSSTTLGVVDSTLSNVFGTYVGLIGLLLTAIVVIRVLPRGITGYLERFSDS